MDKDSPVTPSEITEIPLFTASRMLSRWEEQGLVIASRERVVICNPHGLARIAEEVAS